MKYLFLDDGISKRYIKYNNSKIFTVILLFYGQEIKQFTEKKIGIEKREGLLKSIPSKYYITYASCIKTICFSITDFFRNYKSYFPS